MYNNYQTLSYECDECISTNIYSTNPTLSFIHEIIILYLKELAFYLIRLKNLDITNESIKEPILYTISSMVSKIEYSQEQFSDIILRFNDAISESKTLYENLCKKNNIDIEVIKTYFKRTKKPNLTAAIKRGEKYILRKNSIFTLKEKDLFDIIFVLITSMCIKTIELLRHGEVYDKYYYAILSMLNAMNLNEFSEENAKKTIKKFSPLYCELVKDIFNIRVKLYGKITQIKVSNSTKYGKAILVSGSDFSKLEKVLKATEGKNINVYTHGMEMLMAHSFPKFHSHPNLVGHFSQGMETSLIDFAMFPGSILITRGSLQQIEFLYRGRLFTLDPIASAGVVKLENDNFEPLINSALEAKGFIDEYQRPSIIVGFSEKSLFEKINKILVKIKNNEIKHLYIIGLVNYPAYNTQYFEKFFEILPKDCYVISLSYAKRGKNILNLDFFYNYLLIYKLIDEIKQKIPLNKINMNIFLTKCDKYTIANVVYLKEIGVKNVYMCGCPPNLINPELIKTLQEEFDIKEFSTPEKDLEETLS